MVYVHEQYSTITLQIGGGIRSCSVATQTSPQGGFIVKHIKQVLKLKRIFPYQSFPLTVASHKRLQRSSASSTGLPVPPTGSNGLQTLRYMWLVLQQLFLVFIMFSIEQREELEQQDGRASDIVGHRVHPTIDKPGLEILLWGSLHITYQTKVLTIA